MALTPNGRFAAVAICKRNFILVYDISFATPRYHFLVTQASRLVRVAREYYKEVRDLSFPLDDWSQILAVFTDGTATLYSVKGKSRDVAGDCSYVSSAADPDSPVDLVAVCALTHEHLATDQDKFIKDPAQELGIVAGAFHPSIGLFGHQKSLILAANSNLAR